MLAPDKKCWALKGSARATSWPSSWVIQTAKSTLYAHCVGGFWPASWQRAECQAGDYVPAGTVAVVRSPLALRDAQ